MSSVSLKEGTPVANAEEQPLYAPARRIYPQKVSGTFRRLKWILLIVTLGIYSAWAKTTVGHLCFDNAWLRRCLGS